jgi:hypothetical protein
MTRLFTVFEVFEDESTALASFTTFDKSESAGA